MSMRDERWAENFKRCTGRRPLGMVVPPGRLGILAPEDPSSKHNTPPLLGKTLKTTFKHQPRRIPAFQRNLILWRGEPEWR